MEAKTPGESRVEMREIVLPNDTNNHGNVLGGKVLHLMDMAAAMVAMRHCRKPVVTAALDQMEFYSPIPRGHFMIVKAAVNGTGRTSMEIGVEVLSENPVTGNTRQTSTPRPTRGGGSPRRPVSPATTSGRPGSIFPFSPLVVRSPVAPRWNDRKNERGSG